MKIKTKKQFTLPQLIEWAMKNDMHEKSFCGDRYGDAVHFDENEDMLCDHVSLTETFTVEVEEEITENTVLPKLVERWKHDDEGNEAFRYVEHDDKSINRVLFANPESVEATHFYIENDNQELVLIWRDGKLI
ncbi:hypothetical protein [Staphylococcus phage PT1-4]